MNAITKKLNVGTSLIVLFAIVLTTGIILHLKKHGIVIEFRSITKTIHWICGFLMTAFAIWHFAQFRNMLSAMRRRSRWFWSDSMAVAFTLAATFLTGGIKLLSPVKIPNLGLWHYGLGVAMSVFIAIHLIKAIPAWLRLKASGSRRN